MEERETFEERLGPALDALFDGARLLAGDPQRAEDLVLAVVLDASRRYGETERPRDFRKWIVGRLVGRYLEHADAGPGERVSEPDEAGTAGAAGAAGAVGEADPPEEEALGTLVADLAVLEREDPARLGKLIRRSMRALPDRRRAAVWLVDVMEFSYAEASRALGVAVDAFRESLYRARRDLQRLLGPAARADVERGETAPPRGGEA